MPSFAISHQLFLLSFYFLLSLTWLPRSNSRHLVFLLRYLNDFTPFLATFFIFSLLSFAHRPPSSVSSDPTPSRLDTFPCVSFLSFMSFQYLQVVRRDTSLPRQPFPLNTNNAFFCTWPVLAFCIHGVWAESRGSAVSAFKGQQRLYSSTRHSAALAENKTTKTT